ncbi:tRNA pseudouridine(38-40) synthase TruA [Candidatus Ichthyocystis hellenicum]|uniref:tRNA pseudouridine(38-40) synthase TruA n=1 Tax=Candidatus Ichthyocystis hellenicum TaxID=1561003 RepID=UPI000AF071DF|nr:tRNA pseudouridine(38-40) synthase TruA [Candidatus Ichthyocystis hellenicum]
MRWVLQIEYFGHGFCGWQKQTFVPTIQESLESALSRIAGERVSVVASGRTDRGVHAVGQVVHFDTTAVRHPVAWVRGVNSYLPESVRVLWARSVSDYFHARRSALSRRYRYILFMSPVRPALFAHRVSWTHHVLSEEAICRALPLLVGCYDFSSFRSSECQAVSPVREIKDISLIHRDNFWVFEVEANSFLQHMVRNIIGALIFIGRGLRDSDWLSELILQRSRLLAPPTASPDGLYLLSVKYPAQYCFPSTDGSSLFPLCLG